MKITDAPAVVFLSGVLGAFLAGGAAILWLNHHIDSRIEDRIAKIAIPAKGEKGDRGEKGDKGEKGNKGQKGDRGLMPTTDQFVVKDHLYWISTGLDNSRETGPRNLDVLGADRNVGAHVVVAEPQVGQTWKIRDVRR